MIREALKAGVLSACFVLVVAFGWTASAIAADSVLVRAGIHPTFGRLVFDWPKKVGFKATLNNRLLTIRFDRTIAPRLSKIVSDIDPYIASIKLADDKRTVLAVLNSDVKLRTLTIDNHVVIDLLNIEEPKKADVAKSSGEIVSPPTQDEKKAKNSNSSAQKPNDKPSATDGRISVRTGHHDNYGRLVFGWPRKVGFEVDRKGQTVTLKFQESARLDIAKLRRELPRQISAAVVHPSENGLELGFVVPPDAQLRYFHNENDVVFDVVTKRKKAAVKRSAKSVSKKPVKKTKRKKARPKSYPLISVLASQIGSELKLNFNWRRPVSAAVFRRNSSLWIHFDQPARLEMGSVKSVGNSRFRDAEQKNFDKAVHLRLPIPANARASVRREGTVWVVEIGPKRKRAIQNFPLSVKNRKGKGAELVIKVADPGAVAVVPDEVVGDAIYAVPLRRTGRGIRSFRRFPDFELLRSPQGIAIRPIHDAVRVRRTPTGIVVTKPGGLNISSAAVSMNRRRPHAKDKNLLDLAAWRHGPITDFKKVELDLVQHVAQPNGVRRNAARLSLAKFYASHGMGAEALGVLTMLLKDTPAILRDPAVRALRGLSNFLVGHFAEADADLSHASLAGIRELYPWRAGIAAARGDWAGAYRLFVDTDIVIATLPSEFAVQLGLLAAEAALSVKEKEIAGARLGAVESLPAASGQLDQLAYLKGHLHKLKGNTAKAIETWEIVAADGVRPSRAKASFARINTLVDTGAIKVPEAIKELEKLQFAWRNSVFEYDLLNRLGDLHARQRNLRSALVTLREAVTLFKDIKGAQSLTQKMRDMFRRFYLDGDADHLQPVVALGLYNEFRELTPTGPDGDKMIRLLSERLIKVDLLEDAATLLDHQIRFRLKGEERAKTGARLAEILLLDNKPHDALAALAASDDPTTLESLSENRRRLEAAALMDSRRYEEALNNIAEDFSKEFDMLRAQIYWRAADWPKASRVLARLTGGIDAKRLNDRDAELLLRRAVALGLASDFAGMKFLRDRFGAAMEKSKQAAFFKAVAGGKLLKPKNFAALARRAAELDTFRAFMKTLGGKAAQTATGQDAVLN